MDINHLEPWQLLGLLRSLSAGDRSILQKSLEVPDSQIATVRKSPNDAFWSRLAELGLAREMPLDIDLPQGVTNFLPRSFALTEVGRQTLPALLAKFRP
jgi:hypothetical protein